VEAPGNKLSKWTSILVFHPTIRAYESKLAMRGEQGKTTLDERDIEIGTVIDGLIALFVIGKKSIGYKLLPHIWWIAYYVREVPIKVCEQEIVLYEPGTHKFQSILSWNTPFYKQIYCTIGCGYTCLAMEFYGSYRVTQGRYYFLTYPFVTHVRVQQALHNNEKKVSPTT
jgi:hypothetical protein